MDKNNSDHCSNEDVVFATEPSRLGATHRVDVSVVTLFVSVSLK